MNRTAKFAASPTAISRSFSVSGEASATPPVATTRAVIPVSGQLPAFPTRTVNSPAAFASTVAGPVTVTASAGRMSGASVSAEKA